MEITKDNIDFLLIIGGSFLVLLQVGFHLLKQFFPPKVLLSEESEAYKMLEDVHDVTTPRDFQGNFVIHRPGDSDLQKKMIDVLANVTESQKEISNVLRQLQIATEKSQVLLQYTLEQFKK